MTESRHQEERIERRIRRSIDSTHGPAHLVAQVAADISAHVVINRGGSTAPTRQQGGTDAASAEAESPEKEEQ